MYQRVRNKNAGMYRMSDLINYAFVKDWDINHPETPIF